MILQLKTSHPRPIMPKGKRRLVFALDFLLRKEHRELSQICPLYFRRGDRGRRVIPCLLAKQVRKKEKNYHVKQQNPCSDNKTIKELSARQTTLRSGTGSGFLKDMKGPKCNVKISPRSLRAPFPAYQVLLGRAGWEVVLREPGPHSWEPPSGLQTTHSARWHPAAF